MYTFNEDEIVLLSVRFTDRYFAISSRYAMQISFYNKLFACGVYIYIFMNKKCVFDVYNHSLERSGVINFSLWLSTVCSVEYSGRPPVPPFRSPPPFVVLRSWLAADMTTEGFFSNPLFNTYVFYCSILCLKMLLMSILTGRQRFRKQVRRFDLCTVISRDGTVAWLALRLVTFLSNRNT